MRVQREWMLDLIYGAEATRRFTQDSPVLPDVWLEFADAHGDDPHAALDLLLTPHRESSAGTLYRALQVALKGGARGTDVPRLLAMNQTTVVAYLTFNELVRVVLPLARWCRLAAHPGENDEGPRGRRRRTRSDRASARAAGRWLERMVGTIAETRDHPKQKSAEEAERVFRAIAADEKRWRAAWKRLRAGVREPSGDARDALYQISVNRKAVVAVARSTLAVKADAARRLFNISCDGLGWAVVDSGIDAEHPAFRLRDDRGKPYSAPFPKGVNRTRIVETYDFTLLRPLLTPDEEHDAASSAHRRLRQHPEAAAATTRRLSDQLRFVTTAAERIHDPARRAKALRRGLERGRMIDWEPLVPLLEVRAPAYRAPRNEHGTHVAGVLAADWQRDHWRHDPDKAPQDDDVIGVCPDLRLYDLRVLDDNGEGDEFTVMAALQFVRWLNADREHPRIHGVNLSLSIRHDVANYACGRTPVCDECDRVVATGAVVVAAAGNLGYEQYVSATAGDGGPRTLEGYRSISITDPGNAESVITVGATHRYKPHTYGVSYFSSRGPTGDGRLKPDLVAPGEKISAPVPGIDAKVMDGTSMAAPHVSGAAALLMARHGEFVMRPQRVKQVLCGTATDLGRERYFQGAGMLDILRALQSV